MKKAKRRILPRADINVTPFIDILLVLLVIFMTISPRIPSGMVANVPQPPPPNRQQHDPDKVIVLSMNKNGVIRINQNEVEPTHLIEQLRDIFKSRGDRTIFVQADNELLFNDVAQLIDAAKGAGVEKLGLMTEEIQASR
jgi:biopolymer transport protein TolR